MNEAPVPVASIPATASPRVEFVSQIQHSASTELAPLPERGIDPVFLRRYVRTLEDAGFDYALIPYNSAGADSFVLATAVGQISERLKLVVAVRPNTVFPLVAAQKLATLDQLVEGRTIVHLISGGSDAEQARQGDYLSKDRRYDRTREFLLLLRRAWAEREPFSHEGEFYRFDGFGPGLPAHGGRSVPVSIGGQSDPAFQLGGELGDVFSFWGEPLAAISEQIGRVDAIAAAAGRTDRPRFWVTFRPIIAPTDELAWAKAERIAERIGETAQAGAYFRSVGSTGRPENVGSQRALEFAARGELYDRALWTRTAAVTGARGASVALVGSPETVGAAILDYIDLGASIVSIRGYDTLNDLVDYGRHVLPLVHAELAHRSATGRTGSLQTDHPGAYAPGFGPASAR